MSRPNTASLSMFLFSLSALAAAVTHMDTVQTWFSKASGQPAAIIIDTKGVMGQMPRPWQYIAQGGESPDYRFFPALDKMKAIKPHYVRIDHVYDFYQVVSRDDQGKLVFDWSKLDLIINDITSSGAKPFISLSYMPPALNPSDLTGPPQEWTDWSLVVQKTIEHVSGVSGLNLQDVYYEVWNEPDLFGQWKTYGSKNYLLLYEHAAKGAAHAQNVNSYKFGGPATTKLYDNWVTRFVDYAVKNNLRFDFFSWHHYTPNVDEYLKDYDRYNQLIRRYPDLIFKVEPVISEWGFSSDVHPGYDSDLAAAHLVATLATIMPKIEKLFIFEFQDGKDVQGQAFWGKWGLLTHQDFDSQEKPRYQTLILLNQLGESRLSLIGNGHWTRALAAKNTAGSIQVIMANYDSQNRHAESVPVTFVRLDPGQYQLRQTYLGENPITTTTTISLPEYTHLVNLYPNAVVLIELSKLNT